MDFLEPQFPLLKMEVVTPRFLVRIQHDYEFWRELLAQAWPPMNAHQMVALMITSDFSDVLPYIFELWRVSQ